MKRIMTNEASKKIGEKIKLAGWVHNRRDHGGVIFIDLRDYSGIMQIKFNPEISKKIYEQADKLRNEWVVEVAGEIVKRPQDMINKNLVTGEVEMEVVELKILNKAKDLPFEVNKEDRKEVNENLRLKYRYLDLRRRKLQKLLKDKAEFINDIRQYFREREFNEIQTPILANSSPEGARDWLVPSRLYPGKFYALPQAPQQFKQLLMVGGIEKYFQIAPCFRDEDPRSDRHFGEFYQLDMEMSFVEQEDIFNIMEPLWKEITKKHSNKKIVSGEKSFPRISWREAMNKYGTDKPDLRFGLEIKNISELIKGCDFGVFAKAVENDGVVHTLKVDGGAKFSRKEIDDLTKIAQEKGAGGLAYIIVKEKNTPSAPSTEHLPLEEKGGEEYELQSPIVKFLGDDLAQEIIKQVEARTGDIVFFGADQWRVVCDSLGAVRNECGEKLGLKDNKKAAWVWIVDFPMYDYSEIEDDKIDFSHNPFSMPQGGIDALKNKNPLDIVAYQFDLVLNGFEVSSGAIRNHDPEIMYEAFKVAGYSREDVDEKFGHMIEAFKYGAPPHGGNAPGIDRLFMVLKDCNSIRDIYAFPKDGQGRDVMMDAPSTVEQSQLDELHIEINSEK